MGRTAHDFIANVRSFTDTCTVPSAYMPLLVTIADPKDPRTIAKATAGSMFGGRVAFGNIAISLTDEPVTDGRIQRILPWVGRHPPANIYRLPANESPNGLPLGDNAFARGASQDRHDR